MIVLTSVDKKERHMCNGDEFHLTVQDNLNYEVVIREIITATKVINFVASFRFALEDGTCPGFHLCGIFGNQNELPKEIKNAILLDDLTKEQRDNFIRTVGIQI